MQDIKWDRVVGILEEMSQLEDVFRKPLPRDRFSLILGALILDELRIIRRDTGALAETLRDHVYK